MAKNKPFNMMYFFIILFFLPGSSFMIYASFNAVLDMMQGVWDYEAVYYGAVSGKVGHTIFVGIFVFGSIGIFYKTIRTLIAFIKREKLKE